MKHEGPGLESRDGHRRAPFEIALLNRGVVTTAGAPAAAGALAAEEHGAHEA